MEHMQIRMATMEDLDEIAFVESECFPFEEAAAKEKFAERIKEYGTHFWLMCEEEKVIAFVDGMVTDEKNLTDEMYEKACLHDEKGAWQMIFGVNTLPKYRRQGYAEKLLRYAINEDVYKRQHYSLNCKVLKCAADSGFLHFKKKERKF